MHPKIKNRPAGTKAATGPVKPLLLHGVLKPTASASDASRQGRFAIQPASGSANHARHHVSRHTQS
jgi:hypothetical protein